MSENVYAKKNISSDFISLEVAILLILLNYINRTSENHRLINSVITDSPKCAKINTSEVQD